MPFQQTQFGRLLFEAGWLPTGDELSVEQSDDLLPAILEVWQSCDPKTLSATSRSRATNVQLWLAEQISNGAQLTAVGTTADSKQHWLGSRLIWWPLGQPNGSQIGITSSRLGRRLDTQADWFTVFRAACSKINRDDDVLLTAVNTTPDRFVDRAAELFGVRVVSMRCSQKRESIVAWLKRIRKMVSTTRGSVFPAYLSPESTTGSVAAEHPDADLPTRNRAVVALADSLLVFHLRRNGHLDKLVRARLSNPNFPAGTVFIALGEGLVKRDLADDLLDQGAVGWVVLNTLRPKLSVAREGTHMKPAAIVKLPPNDKWEWLTHCTRAQADAWPDQERHEYIDELLLASAATDHSAFAALRRIIDNQRLVASSRMIRGDTRVVCFTAVPLSELPQLRSFRSHLARWDFEPYGICIRREWLESRDCLPVRYGDDSLWASLDLQDRPYFQVQTSTCRQSGRTIDWSVEREWRHVGDVELEELPANAGLVFVPTREEAEQLVTISRWPVTVLDG